MKNLSYMLSLTVVAVWSAMAWAGFPTPEIRLDTNTPPGHSDSHTPFLCNTSDGYVYALWADENISGSDLEFFFNRSTDYGRTWQPTQNVFSLYYGGSMFCTENGGVYIVWVQDYLVPNSLSVLMRKSSDHGATWGAEQTIATVPYDPSLYFIYAANTSLGVTEDGHIYILMAYGMFDYLSSATISSTPIFYYSANNGTSWSSGYSFAPDFYSNNFLQFTQDGHVYIAYMGYDAWFGNTSVEGIYVYKSANYGQTWSLSRFMQALSTATNSVFLSNTENGMLYLAWGDKRNGQTDAYFNRSTDHGATWQITDQRLDTGSVPGTSASTITALESTESGNVYVSYMDLRNSPTNSDLYMNRSSDYGVSWQSPDIRLDFGDNLGEHNSSGRIIADDNSRVFALYSDNRNGGQDLLFTMSTDGGVTWPSTPERVNTGSPVGSGRVVGGFGSSCDSNGNLYAAWSDDRTVAGNTDIYFNYRIDSPDMTPTLSEYMLATLGAALLFMLVPIVRRKAEKIT